MRLPFEPACRPLLLGSLPYRSAAQALDVSRRYAGALLAWPQLPRRRYREAPLVQAAVGLPGLVVDETARRMVVSRDAVAQEIDRLALAYLEGNSGYAALGDDSAAGLWEMLRQRDSVRGALALKGQCMGPISVALQLTDEQQRPLIYDDMLFDALVQLLRLRLAWQERQLRDLNPVTVICIDEPFLESLGQPFLPLDWDEARERIATVFADVRGCRGIYAAGVPDWGEVLELEAIDLIIADVAHHSAALVGAAESLGAFLQRGGVVGLGLAPSEPDELANATAAALLQRLDRLLEQFAAAGLEPEQVLRQAVITPAGPLGWLEPAEAEQALRLTSEVAAALRARLGMEEAIMPKTSSGSR